MGERRTYLKCISIILVISIVFVLSSCSGKEEAFPSFDNPTTSTTNPISSSLSTDTVTGELQELSVALPYTSSTIEYLAQLYYCKTNGLLSDTDSGMSVSLSYLSSIDLPFTITSVQTPDVGVSLDNVSQWIASGSTPDIFLTNDYNALINSGYCQPMEDYLADSILLSGSNIYTDALFECMRDSNLYGVPHYSSTMLIMGNIDFAPASGVMQYSCSYTDLLEYLGQIQSEQEILSNDSTIPIAYCEEMIPYLGQAFSLSSSSFMLRDEYALDPNSAQTVADSIISYIDSIYENGYTIYGGAENYDPVFSRDAALWIDSTTNLYTWSEYYPSTLYFLQIPSAESETLSPPYLTIYPICLSTSSDCADLAANFAAFVSYDSDALQLIYRLEHRVGFFPFIKDPDVWSLLESDSVFGSVVSYIEFQMQDAIYSPNVMQNEMYNSVSSYISEYSSSAYSSVYGVNDTTFDLSECLTLEG